MSQEEQQQRKQACIDMIQYMEAKRSEWNNAKPFIHEYRASQVIDAAKEYLKQLS